ncbi:GNAT family N-acetyltransferase [Spirochaeta isovalerica]|uniref:GNAT superfamily N-acetyltransferase n=1 Tax=Spirochaeta isovalerica TaxID=150 RepID=A0A841RGD1_9SPIO|nr:GNAT family N-acetyltransferase [Spirochaeta isovalerica]MBB6482277.1 GNAT superfamily N-acetyltransferase [Spirochaeta isovalerica]
MKYEIRNALESDASQILQFIKELADYEKAPDQVSATVEDIRTSLFGDGATAHALICESEKDAVGFAVYFYNYSTWQGKRGLYLEDLYITPEYRGKGAGGALLKYLARKAVKEQCGRFEWSVLDWNEPAIGFYKSIGAIPKEGWIGYQLAGEALLNYGKIEDDE